MDLLLFSESFNPILYLDAGFAIGATTVTPFRRGINQTPDQAAWNRSQHIFKELFSSLIRLKGLHTQLFSLRNILLSDLT